MDTVDIASEREMATRELALSRQRNAQRSQTSATHCQECGEVIPQARQLAVPGVALCVECQALRERRT